MVHYQRKRKKCLAEKHPLYSVWRNMRYRCNCPTAHKYKLYGARNIKVCDRWNDFWKFVEDMGEKPTKNHSLDRINSDGGYEPNNCRWATFKEQNRNKRNNVLNQEIANKIINELNEGKRIIDITTKFNISRNVVNNIKFKDCWK